MDTNNGPLIESYEYNIDTLPLEQRSTIPSPDPVLEQATLPTADRSSSRPFIPVCEPDIDAAALENLQVCVEENWISSGGRFVTEFESQFAELTGVKHCIATSSGTTALYLLLAACGIKAGDEVIIPSFTMVAVASSVVHLGARPIFVDCDAGSENANRDAILKKVTERTRAIIIVHTYGRPFDVTALLQHVDTSRIAVLEDAAEAHGASIHGKNVGSLSYGASFSFYANKIITTGEGGAITTDNDALANVCRTMRDHAFSPERHFWHRYRGYNFRMTNLQAAVGVSQLANYRRLCEARKTVAAKYTDAFSNLEGLILPEEDEGTEHAFWVYFLRVDPEIISRDQLRLKLARNGIETRTAFVPLHLQPAYREFYDEKDCFKNAEQLAATGLYLPSSSKLTSAELEYVCLNVCRIFSELKANQCI